jgi:cell wall-associated NlpC family hydrolase
MNAHQKIAIYTVAASLFLLAGCSTAPPRYSVPTDAYANAVELPSRLSPEQATDITIYAMGLIGTPYRYGGNTPDSGFDCSGLIGHVYQSRAGVATPRTVSRLQDWGQSIPGDNLRSGDLVLFGQRDVATHAGIYVGNGRFVHAPSTGGKVRIDRLDSKYWSARQMAFRRP